MTQAQLSTFLSDNIDLLLSKFLSRGCIFFIDVPGWGVAHGDLNDSPLISMQVHSFS